MSILLSTRRAGGLGAAALALAMAGALPAHADHGNVATGLILGLAGGVALDQLATHAHPPQGNVFVSPPPPVQRRVVREYIYMPPPPSASPLRHAFVSQGRRERISIQYRLMMDGYYSATPDGLWGPDTARALFHYARAHHREGMLTTRHGADRLFARILG